MSDDASYVNDAAVGESREQAIYDTASDRQFKLPVERYADADRVRKEKELASVDAELRKIDAEIARMNSSKTGEQPVGDMESAFRTPGDFNSAYHPTPPQIGPAVAKESKDTIARRNAERERLKINNQKPPG